MSMGSIQYLVTDTKENPTFPGNLAILGMHLSQDGMHLAGIPETVPEGCILLLDDRILPEKIDEDAILRQLASVLHKRSPKSLYLDFQRESVHSTSLIRRITESYPEITAVSALYAEGLSCPVVLPPIPLYKKVEEVLSPWQGREIWIEQDLSAWEVTVTKDGADVKSTAIPRESGFFDEALCCRYCIKTEENAAIFTLFSTSETLQKQAEKAASLGVKAALIPSFLCKL